jgi:type II secretory pathway predicted ATPase ExeA/outer membrane protein OmpA-like peptidoglycan-associated protein
MYESYFKFNDTPFRLSADEKFRYAHKNYLRASAYLAYALEQGEGFVMITGQPGSGKTTLIRDVISELDEARYHTLNLVTSQLQAEELLRKVALEYGFPAENANKATLLTNIQKHLSSLHNEGKRSILFLDEAQNLSLNGLEELRLLSNLQQGKHSLLQIVLVGHNELRDLILNPDMSHVQQRLIASCQIEPLPLEQTREYILHRLEHAGWQSDPKIEDEVFQLIHTASQGVPRNINHLMSHLLLFACLEEKHHLIDEDALTIIEELIDQQRITLAGEESFESYADRYRAEKQHQVVRKVVANHSSGSLTQEEPTTWNHETNESLSAANHIDHKRLTPVNDNIAPESDSERETDDSDWFLWLDETPTEIDNFPTEETDTSSTDIPPDDEHPETSVNESLESELTLPNADDIWNGTVPSTDMDNFFPENRRKKSTFSVEPSKNQPTTQPAEEQVTVDREKRSGGVGFKSSRDKLYKASKSLNTISIPKPDHNIAVNENLSMPSVWVDDCPDIVATQGDTSHHQLKPKKSSPLKRSVIHVTVWVIIGIVLMLAVRMFPNEFNQLLHILETPQLDNGNGIEESVTPLSPEEGKAVIRENEITWTNPTTQEGVSTNTSGVNTGRKLSDDAAYYQLPNHDQNDNKIAALAPQPTARVDVVNEQSETSEIITPGDTSPVEDSFNGPSFHNIELATRYMVYFDFNKSTIPSQYEPLLKSIRNKMLLEENNFLKITGYADSQGNGNYNYRLSLKRAEAVKEYFILRGIADDRLQAAAVGSVKRGEPRLESLDVRKAIRRVEVILFPKHK